MLTRFGLYGFLKNQRYFEAFLVLVLLERGLTFFAIGLLIGFREIAINVLEIPSGAIADVWGRRRSMILSLVAYIASFAVFGFAERLGWFFLAMFLYAVGDAFRTGTHKALIFAWLRGQGRTDERTKVYGYTRSWSQFGSAVSVILATVLVFLSDDYSILFFAAIVPYVLGIINLLGYPAALEAASSAKTSAVTILGHMSDALKASFTRRGLKRLILESMGFEGVFHAVKDYLQPVVQAAALATAAGLVVMDPVTETQKTALMIGPIYFVLFLLAGVASRQSYRVAQLAGAEDRAARLLWGSGVVLFAGLLAAAWYEKHAWLIAAFCLLHVLQNLWRPILISRFDIHSTEAQGATILSIESQARRASTMVLAPLVGLVIDLVKDREPGGSFWPIGALGLVVTLTFFLSASKGDQKKNAGE